jgi:NADPH-dependent glutamate synthase beta subunit-like oxidoreductase
MAFKVRLYTIQNEVSALEYQSPLSATKDDTFATFRVFLENEGLVDFAFNFWIPDDKKRMLQRFERFNTNAEKVFVIHRGDLGVDSAKQRKVTDKRAVVLDSKCALTEWLDTAVEKDDIEVLEPGSSSRAFEEDEVVPVSLFNRRKCRRRSCSSTSK